MEVYLREYGRNKKFYRIEIEVITIVVVKFGGEGKWEGVF